jgi:predicted nucleic acid-binding protein
MPLANVSLQDADDIPVLSAARNGGAEILVTGDTELKALAQLDRMRILSPRQLWDEFRGQPGR